MNSGLLINTVTIFPPESSRDDVVELATTEGAAPEVEDDTSNPVESAAPLEAVEAGKAEEADEDVEKADQQSLRLVNKATTFYWSLMLGAGALSARFTCWPAILSLPYPSCATAPRQKCMVLLGSEA